MTGADFRYTYIGLTLFPTQDGDPGLQFGLMAMSSRTGSALWLIIFIFPETESTQFYCSF
ncbi:hypothetical protein SAMN05192562_101828 [Kosakonia arachidis]|uniref:Uncharacterized protein n=1 Tax=Kosakonia arachidis TaxID=551989 RepID=A0A1I6YY69_9ENTR|nr:hypothetical protein SAMN05192562_101828 [Kosakonia arachidis]